MRRNVEIFLKWLQVVTSDKMTTTDERLNGMQMAYDSTWFQHVLWSCCSFWCPDISWADSLINSDMETFPANYLVLPGDDVTDVIQKVMGEEKFVVGPGLRRKEKICTAVKSGILRYKKRPDVFWVDSFQRRVRYLFKMHSCWLPCF